MQLRPTLVHPVRVASALEDRFGALRRFLACAREEVTVAVTRDPNGAVAEMLLYFVRVPPVGDEDGGAGVPEGEVFEPDSLHDGGARVG